MKQSKYVNVRRKCPEIYIMHELELFIESILFQCNSYIFGW